MTGAGWLTIRSATFAVSMLEPPPTETKPSTPAPRAKSAAACKESSVGSTRAPSYWTTSIPASASTVRTRAACSATPGSETSSARVTPRRCNSHPASCTAPGPNLIGVASSVKTDSRATSRFLPDDEAGARDAVAVALGDVGGDRVAALLHAARAAEGQRDEPARDRGDRVHAAGATGRAADRVRAAERVDRVTEVADRQDDLAAADLRGACAPAVDLARRVQAQLGDDPVLRDDALAALGVGRLAEDVDAAVERAAARTVVELDRDPVAAPSTNRERPVGGAHVAVERRAHVADHRAVELLTPRTHVDAHPQRLVRRVVEGH